MTGEAQIQFIWKHRLFSGKALRTTCGKALEVLSPGEENFHAGPDFFNARIRLDQLIWAGNVEVHVHASHWNIHGHHLDPAYDNVILHVIQHYDLEVKNNKGRSIPSLTIDPLSFPLSPRKNVSLNENWLFCQNQIGNLNTKARALWYRRMYNERLNLKIHHFTHLMERYPYSREKALFVAMASGFGLPINKLPFELMANGIPLSLLDEIKDSLPDLEALLFGQSGLLQAPRNKGPYTSSLLHRYSRFNKGISLTPVPDHLWKFLRIRPASFPTLRLSQFAQLIHLHFPFYEKFIRFNSVLDAEQWLDLQSSSFWNTHYTFKKPSPFSVKKMGPQTILNLSVNVLIPFMAAIQKTDPLYHSFFDPEKYLNKLKAESNHITRKWITFGIAPGNAFESQALIQLYSAYCKQKRCIDCQIGKKISSCIP